jgi:hypothetical protein
MPSAGYFFQILPDFYSRKGVLRVLVRLESELHRSATVANFATVQLEFIVTRISLMDGILYLSC